MSDRVLHCAAAVVWLLTFLHAAPARSQEFETVGVRALGMGGAFVAVADDATATYWNPAGLATGPFFSMVLDRGVGEQIDQRAERIGDRALGTSYSSSVLAMSTPPFGFFYYRLRAAESTAVPKDRLLGDRQDMGSGGTAVSSLVTHHAGVTLVQSLWENIAVGATIRLVRGGGVRTGQPAGVGPDRIPVEAAGVTGSASNAFDVDVGLMATVGRMRVGVVARNLRQPEFADQTGAMFMLNRQIRAGVSVTPADDLIVAADVSLSGGRTSSGSSRVVAVGGERWWLARRVGVRAGLRASAVGETKPVGAAGFSVAARSGVYIDGQVTRGDRHGERGWTIGARVVVY